ncbi:MULTISPECIES: LysR family transcriptional regulator [Pseudomonas]|jgi:DNA-binding transcriptional LysR family regulator|uniref:LysR family transcriptional regulator n=1 Tax=Pseudomonas TaxID=286 RepID=UPI00142F8AC2|nr:MULTISPECIES: LysR substrate-binding domain-containing protein [unclassified Pseudomonas]WEL44827.1 LysR substrate-binding domain-containing protein [Pseudomonas sp. CBSPBW29]WEL65917.1 LysR substrate-binding domain-containing protein [Pseudomonas sp. CBSPGW29]WEL69393.1 LysR substrate-binding domain-containing protein [Pseudomonas sp. CBSPCGW29]WEL76377.1 LysR substrate-binding domain-containing protein [Pseudomonas sp. CBSPAW29]WEL87840.1 LysR substrate-binding domain-containing protein [
MELAQLKMVKAVAQTGSVAQAALQLHCVPSNITTRIKQLESELGTPLFIRAGRGLAISAAGEVFLDYCERILALVEESKRAVDSNAIPRGKLRIGAVESSASGRLPPLLAEYHRRYPQVELELVTGAWAQLLDDLQHHRIDAALVAAGGKRPKLEQSVVYSERLVLITSASSAPIEDARDLAGRTLLVWPPGCPYRAALENWLKPHDIKPAIASYASWGTIIGCVSAGIGVALAPEGILARYEQANQLTSYRFDELAAVDNLLFWHKDTQRHLARDAFAGLLRETFS